MKIKRLGNEYKNTCIAEFINVVDEKRLLDVLFRLRMISTHDYHKFHWANMLLDNETRDSFISVMNEIAPEGTAFDIKTVYKSTDEEDCEHKILSAGFFTIS